MSSSRPNYGSTSQPSGQAPSKPAKTTEGAKIEPKVWFANERTWLNWSRTGVLLGTFGVAIVNASVGHPSHTPRGRSGGADEWWCSGGGQNGTAAKALGVVYAAIAVATIWYGWLVYQKRIKMIRDRYPGHFGASLALSRPNGTHEGRADELVVPVMIGMALFIAIVLNFAFRIVDRSVPISFRQGHGLDGMTMGQGTEPRDRRPQEPVGRSTGPVRRRPGRPVAMTRVHTCSRNASPSITPRTFSPSSET